jgi:hypothetical protein
MTDDAAGRLEMMRSAGSPTTATGRRRSRRALRTIRLALPLLALGTAGRAHGWELMTTTNAYGDHATGIIQPAQNAPGVNLVVACEGDRWRNVVIGPPPGGGGFPLDDGGKVRVSFSAEPGPKEKWQVRRRPKTHDVLYLAPAPSAMVRDMVGRADASPDATLYARVESKGKPVTLQFPLVGLRQAIRKDLWEPCKLGNQIPESEFR